MKVNVMTKSELLFSIDFGIRSMEFACADDSNYVATFVDENNETWRFTASRRVVLEHVERFTKKPEKYLTNKALVVSHFHHMAMAWYAKTHLPKRDLEMLT